MGSVRGGDGLDSQHQPLRLGDGNGCHALDLGLSVLFRKSFIWSMTVAKPDLQEYRGAGGVCDWLNVRPTIVFAEGQFTVRICGRQGLRWLG